MIKLGETLHLTESTIIGLIREDDSLVRDNIIKGVVTKIDDDIITIKFKNGLILHGLRCNYITNNEIRKQKIKQLGL